MGFIPKDAKWYLAEIVEEIGIDGERDNILHTNMVLVRADSPEQAYDRAVELGKEGEITYSNPDGKLVRTRYRGLRDLNVIHDELEHGAELIYSRRTGVSEAEILRWVSPKEDLGVFRPIRRPDEDDESGG